MSNLSMENPGSAFSSHSIMSDLIDAGPNLGSLSGADFTGGGGANIDVGVNPASFMGEAFTSGSSGGNLAEEAGGLLGGLGLGGLGDMLGNFAPELAATGGALGAGLGGLLCSFDR